MTTLDIDAIEARLIAPRHPDTGDYLLAAIYALKTLPLVCAEVRELRAANERAEAALEQARALLAEQAEIITANVWHIPPEYSARNIVLDSAVKMRDLAALLAAASGGDSKNG